MRNNQLNRELSVLLKLVLSLLLVIMTSCSSQYSFQEAVYAKNINQISYNHSQFMKEKYNAFLSGTGGAMMGKVSTIHHCFEIVDRVDISQARVIYVDSVLNLLQKVNSDKELKSHLSQSPFTSEGITTQISFTDTKGNYLNSDYISLVSMYKGVVQYSVWSSSTKSYQEVHSEPYEEAVRIVQRATP